MTFGSASSSKLSNSGANQRIVPVFFAVPVTTDVSKAGPETLDKPKSARHALPDSDTRMFAYGNREDKDCQAKLLMGSVSTEARCVRRSKLTPLRSPCTILFWWRYDIPEAISESFRDTEGHFTEDHQWRTHKQWALRGGVDAQVINNVSAPHPWRH